MTPLPAPHILKEYPRALIVHQYEVEAVEQGACPQRRIQVAHWVIVDGRALPQATAFQKGQTYTLAIERHREHPELQPERLIQDSEWTDAPLYYDVGWQGR